MSEKPKKKTIEFDEFEQSMIVKGLQGVIADAEKISAAAERMSIGNAAKEADKFKKLILELQDKVAGKEKLI